MAYYTTKKSWAINPKDEIEYRHYEIMTESCDTNFDGSVDECEIHACIVKVENKFRAEKHPGFGFAYCPCPVPKCECEGSKNCKDINK